MTAPPSDRTPLLDNGLLEAVPNNANTASLEAQKQAEQAPRKSSGIINVVVTFVFIAAIVVSFAFWNERLSSDPHKAALSILSRAPVIVSTFTFDFAERLCSSLGRVFV